MASFFRNPPRTYSRKAKGSAPVVKKDSGTRDKSLCTSQGRILQNHLFSSSDNLDSTASSSADDSRPKRQAVKKIPATEAKENTNDSTIDSDVSRKRRGSSDDSSFDVSACIQRLKTKKETGKVKSQKTRTQPTRASQRNRSKAPSEKKSNVVGPVNTSDEFEKPKAKRLKKSNSKQDVSAAPKPKKNVPAPVPENIPDFADFENFELEVETTISKTPERKKDLNLLSPLRENSWENIGKTTLNGVSEVRDGDECEEKTEEPDRKLTTLAPHDATKDYNDFRSSSAEKIESPPLSVGLKRVLVRPQSSPYPDTEAVQNVDLPARAKSLFSRVSTGPTSPSTSPPVKKSKSINRVSLVGPSSKTASLSPHSPLTKSYAVHPDDTTLPLPSSSCALGAPPSNAESVFADSSTKRIADFPTPERNERQLPDFSRISFCSPRSPFVAGNLGLDDEEVGDLGPLVLKANHLRRLGMQSSSTSTPLQNFTRTCKLAPAPNTTGSPIIHSSLEKKSSSPAWNNVTRRRRFERNQSSENLKDSVFGDSSIIGSGHHSGSPPLSVRNRLRHNATSNSSASLRDSKISMDLFDGSQSAFEPSMKAAKEGLPKLSLSHIVEESADSRVVTECTEIDFTSASDVPQNLYSTANDASAVPASTTVGTTLLTNRSDLGKMDRTNGTNDGTNAAEEEGGDHDDYDEERSRRLDEFLAGSIVGRGSLPNLLASPFETSFAVSRNNHSCPAFRFDRFIEILINDEPHWIGCFAKDDPWQVAREFIAENHIDPQQLEALADFISKELHGIERENGERAIEEIKCVPDEAIESGGAIGEAELKANGNEDVQISKEDRSCDERDKKFAIKEISPKATNNVSRLSSRSSVVLNLNTGDDVDAEDSIVTPKSSCIVMAPSSVSSLSSLSSPVTGSVSADDEASMSTNSRGKDSPGAPESVSADVVFELESPASQPEADVKDARCTRDAVASSLPIELMIDGAVDEKVLGNGVERNFVTKFREDLACFRPRFSIETSRHGSPLSLARQPNRNSLIEMPSSTARDRRATTSSVVSSGHRLSRILRNGKTFLDASPVKSPPPEPPSMSLVDAIGEGETVGDLKLSLEENTIGGGTMNDKAPLTNTAADKPDVFKMPILPAPKPAKANVRKSTRASTASARVNAVEERETRRRSIMRNLRRSKKIAFSPEAESGVPIGNENENSASPLLDRKVTRRQTVAPLPSESQALVASVDKRRATVMMTPIQKLAQWQRASTIVTPSSVGSVKSTSSSTKAPSTVDAEVPSKAAKNLNAKFQLTTVPTLPKIGTPASSPSSVEEKEASPSPQSAVIVLKRLSSEEIAMHTSDAATLPPEPATPPSSAILPVTPAWIKSRRLLTSPKVVLSPLVRHLQPTLANLSIHSPAHNDLSSLHPESSFQLDESLDPDDARSRVLEVCDQTTELRFYDVYSNSRMAAMRKIGEGTYGEVYLSFDEETNQPVALKVIPIEGDDLVNDEKQKTYAEMLSEAVITKEMSELSAEMEMSENRTGGFIRVNRICAFRGAYPPELLRKWDEWSRKNKSWNDRPDFYTDDQLFLVFEFSEGGSDLEKFRFTCPHDAMSVFRQTAMALAVGEAELEFEHRDLHWGNVLIKKLDQPETIVNVLDGVQTEMVVNVRVSIIDFTLSRLKRGGLTQFTDLAEDPAIFEGAGEDSGDKDGDYQFDCYRLMRDETGDDWKPHAPRTNVIWLRYLAKKLIEKMRAMNKKQKASADWKAVLAKLTELRDGLLECSTVASCLIMIDL